MKSLDQAILQNPLVADAWIYKGYSLFELGRTRIPRTLLIKRQNLHRKIAGSILSGERNPYPKRFKEAVADFDRALAAEPENEDAIYGRGVSCIYLSRYDEGSVRLTDPFPPE